MYSFVKKIPTSASESFLAVQSNKGSFLRSKIGIKFDFPKANPSN